MMSKEAPLDNIPEKGRTHVRFITFNINGYRTVFHYHPWNKLRTFNNMFDSLHGDIITLQEIKVAAKDINHSIGKIPGYNAFLTVPSLKKGYSGVAVYVRIPKIDESESVKAALKVIKAEEGITGILKSHDTQVEYRNSDLSIGGYPNLEEDISHQIDNEGRCIILEMGNGIVVISVYCPANSMGTEEGEQFRLQFFEALFSRIRNLEKLGKHVVLMGDINISKDLIDSADGINDRMKMGKLLKISDPHKFEELNREQALNFIRRSLPRIMLNELLIDSIDQDMKSEKSRVMIDTVRKIQGRKHGLYTVWNTLTNSRPGNYGSRIDLILATSTLATYCNNANIWPFLMGSDHCPVFSDFNVEQLEAKYSLDVNLPKLEARFVYKLSGGSIDSMFANMAKKRSSSTSPDVVVNNGNDIKRAKPSEPQKKKSVVKATKGQNQISNFFRTKKSNSPSETKPPVDDEDSDVQEVSNFELSQSLSQSQTSTNNKTNSVTLGSNGQFSISFEKIPHCKHDEPCILKTAMTKENKGKKFWTCSKPKGHKENEIDDMKFTCGFFKWK
ncbi:DNA-(apurinic or apyrimidinic site) lyase 2 [Wickerhamomyces ciferrii]|uniref:DNA-(apurinic or apyrimidinic site) endonuclease 2 n=1 Tax=Wickerhamomyces ciferrii (strain ATCC 14091 / BCRC 22168 / CBS 111 / JCM 3599 / NBRC 0793 / NRRL Y-1031 F-60-10) TaxID=1206466 RepID=K0KHG6_WICCF|nr:DNA-(apurinic or apyrimidinic site) lyase 2 [Wickerhamomyces ciferrii]CCH42456.1 DNA-(apurinic or apyrimidinic site) lyase 2 [Wickerhamomyces ciferrii]